MKTLVLEITAILFCGKNIEFSVDVFSRGNQILSLEALLAGASFARSLMLNAFFFLADKMGKQDKPESDRTMPLNQGSSSGSITSPPGGAQQQVCLVLQPPLPSLSNRSSSPTSLGSLADNVRPSSVPIILAPSPALSCRPLSSPQGSRSSTPTDPAPKLLESSEGGPGDETSGSDSVRPGSAVSPVSSPRAKASIHDI